MIKPKAPEDWRLITPILAFVGPLMVTILVSTLGFFMLRTLNQIDDSIRKQSEKLDAFVQDSHRNEVINEKRLGTVESEVKYLDMRVDRIERSKQIVMK